MKVLLIHDDSVTSELLCRDLGGAPLAVDPISAESLDDSAIAARCADTDAVVCVSTGWDEATAERELRQLEAVIAALRGSNKRLVYLSESTVIGDTGAGFGNEDSPRSTQAPHPWRVAAEALVEAAVFTGIHSVIVRPALIHGREAGVVVQALVRNAANTGEAVYVGDGTGRVSTVHIDDVVALIRHVVVSAPTGATYVAASNEAVSWHDLASAVARVNRGHCEVVSISPEAAMAAGLDAAALTMTNIVRDHTAYRRFGWQPTGQTLVADAMTSAR